MLPFADGLGGDAQLLRQLVLGQPQALAVADDALPVLNSLTVEGMA